MPSAALRGRECRIGCPNREHQAGLGFPPGQDGQLSACRPFFAESRTPVPPVRSITDRVSALVRLRRAACAIEMIPIANETIRQMVEKYDMRLPALKKLRNFTEHYDDYILKQGRDRTIDPETIRSGILTKYISTENINWIEYVTAVPTLT